MAVYLTIGRVPSILLLALLGLAVVAGTASYLSRPEPETGPAAQITATVPLMTPRAETMPGAFPPAIVSETEAALAPEAAPDIDAVQTALAKPAANADQSGSRPTVAPAVAPAAPPAAAPSAAPVAPPAEAAQGQVTVARLAVEPQVSPARHDPAASMLRPRDMAPMPKRSPRAATARTGAARKVATLFQSGTQIRVKNDASVYITARNIPENDRLLKAYSVERPNGGQVQTRSGEAKAVPGLLGIAAQTLRMQGGGQDALAYSLADAMRDAIWRKNTAARLKSLTTAQNACAVGAGDIARNAPSIGFASRC